MIPSLFVAYRRSMEKITWNAYNRFRCIAEKCEDSCCKDWEVDVDEQSASFYRTLDGALGDRLRQVLKTQDGASFMVLENGRCPMWRQDGLCRLQAELGHDALCQVCREYPRLYMDYGDFTEWGLEMSCPEAARLLFADMFAETEVIPGGDEPEYDTDAMAVLQKSRAEILRFWEDSSMTIPQRLAVTLYYAHQVQGTVDGGEYVPLNPENCLQLASSYAGEGDFSVLLQFISEREILTDAWKNRLATAKTGCWDSRLEKLALYLIRRYWLQAVWDYDLVCRAKLIVSACILVNGVGGDTVETAQLFSKEIENNPDNREAILDGAYTEPAFTDTNLFGILFH